MKKKLAIGVVAVMLCAVMAGAESVVSRNAVGYVRVTVPRGVFVMMQSPFEQLDGGIATVGDVVGDDLPIGTLAYIWNEQEQAWISESFARPGFGQDPVWNPGTNKLTRGRGFFLQIPSEAAQETYDILIMGEVPDTFSAPTSEVELVEGFQMLGFMYPVAKHLSETALGQVATIGDAVFILQPDGMYASSTYARPGFGQDPVWNPDILLEPGRAVFYRSEDAKPWEEVKSDYYEWP